MACRAVLLLVAALLSAPLFAAQTSGSVAVGAAPAMVHADSRTGKVFVVNVGSGRGAPATITVIESGGRVSTVPLAVGPVHLAASAAARKLVLAQWGSQAAIVDMDTLRTSIVETGMSPVRTVVAEATGKAYVLAKGLTLADGTITEIDLKTYATRMAAFPQFPPMAGDVDPRGTRLYVMGGRYERTGEWLPGYVQAFDTFSMRSDALPQRIGRMPREIKVAPDGSRVFVLGHVDYFRGNLPADDMRRSSIRGAFYVLDPTLGTRLVAELPDTKSLDLYGPALQGEMRLDPLGANAYLTDFANQRLMAVDTATGAIRTTDLESNPSALGVNAAAGTVLAAMPLAGQLGVFGLDGARLDTVPLGRAPAKSFAAAYAIAVDASSGDAYVTVGPEDTLTLLPRDPGGPSLANATDLWHDPAEPGWGLFMDQQGTTAFGALFTYGASGDATWHVMSSGARQSDGGFHGLLYRTEGPAHLATRNVLPVGFLRFTPAADGGATVTFVIDGLSKTRKLARFGFAAAPRPCGWSLDAAKSTGRENYTALWSNPVDPGWGIAMSHQGRGLFAVLFTYDEQNRPAWMVMSNGRETGTGQFTGDLYRTAKGKVTAIGTMSLRFAAADEGQVTWRIDGTDFRAPLLKQSFASVRSRCE